jgi:hypothetical protein
MKQYSYTNVAHLLNTIGTSDKNTFHKYGEAYNLIFNSQYLKQNRPLKVLEVGISLFGEGSVGPFSSIPFVEKYVGIDNQPYQGTPKGEKIVLYAGPQYDAYKQSTIDFLKEKEEGFDIIIDDGPHTWESQEYFLRNYDQLLNSGGVLVCEDIHDYHNLLHLKHELSLYILDLRFNIHHPDEVLALRYKE